MGIDFLDNGISPWLDHYSFTFPGKEISSVPVLFQVTLAALVSFFGEETGFIVFKIAYVTLILFVIYLFFKRVRAPWFVIFMILPVLIYFINMRLIVRPDAVSNILTILCLILYLRARENFNTKELLPICLLLLFWVNYHSPILGYIIIFGLFLDRAIYKLISNDDGYTWKQWFAWGTIIFSIGFINPAFEHVLILVFSLSNEWYQYLSEYAPSYISYSTNKMVHLSLLASIISVFLAIIKRHYGLVFIVTLLSYYAWSISRLLPVVSLINLCVLAFFLSQINYTQLLANIRPALRVTIALSSLILFIFTLGQTSSNTLVRLEAIRNLPQHIQLLQEKTNNKFPAQVSDYLNSFQSAGNVINTFNAGGYLIHTLSPKFKIYIDGRTNILYPISFYQHYLDILSDIHTLENDAIQYSIDYAIFENTARAHRHFSETDMFTVNFSNENYILFSRNKDIAFPLASKLTIFPMCWNDRFSKVARAEISLSKNLFSDKAYTIKYILKLLDDYLSHTNKAQFIGSLQPDSFLSDTIKRLAAYLAINENNYQIAKSFFKAIEVKNNDDLLMVSYSLTKTEDYDTAKSVLAYYLKNKGGISKDLISDSDKIIIIKILTAISEKSGSQKLASFDLNQIKEKLGMDNSQYTQTLSTSLPYKDTCKPIFKFQ